MTTPEPAQAWAQPQPVKAPTLDPDAYALADVLRTLIALGSFTTARSTQVSLGSSEAGHPCDRRLAYKLRRSDPATSTAWTTAQVQQQPAHANLRDPLRALVGSGFHAAVAEIFTRLDGGSGRFLVESSVEYRGTPGTADLYDRWTGTVIDWKSSLKSKISHIRRDGPSAQYLTQVQLYGAALKARGEDVRTVALAWVPVDGELSGVYVWRAPFDQTVADEAIDRLVRLRGLPPEKARATPDRLCPWCSHYLPGSTDLTIGCPGEVKK